MESPVDSWLQLWRVHQIGPAAFHKLLAAFGTPEQALNASPAALQQAGMTAAQIDALTGSTPDISEDLRWLEAEENHLLRVTDPDYPGLLSHISHPPPLLFVKGDASLLKHPQLAMVGSRNPTRGGLTNAKAFAAFLAEAGLGITSGLALGIDGAAHEGALSVSGITLAVAATGLDRIYPARHRKLAADIAAKGALISEFPIGTQAKASHFPRRNRIISGLSYGTLVVEAAKKSGSLITSRYAMEQGREVFAIPGSIHNPLARGCHSLIRQGVKLVETGQDVLEELAPLLHLTESKAKPASLQDKNQTSDIDPDQAKLLALVDYEPTPVELVISRSGLTAESVSSMLLIMELNGLVASEAGGCYIRLDPKP